MLLFCEKEVPLQVSYQVNSKFHKVNSTTEACSVCVTFFIYVMPLYFLCIYSTR